MKKAIKPAETKAQRILLPILHFGLSLYEKMRKKHFIKSYQMEIVLKALNLTFEDLLMQEDVNIVLRSISVFDSHVHQIRIIKRGSTITLTVTDNETAIGNEYIKYNFVGDLENYQWQTESTSSLAVLEIIASTVLDPLQVENVFVPFGTRNGVKLGSASNVLNRYARYRPFLLYHDSEGLFTRSGYRDVLKRIRLQVQNDLTNKTD